MSDLILKLALQAMHDEDALPVLLDAIEETGWDSESAMSLWEDNAVRHEGAVWSWPRAIAAVLLFECWPTSWPLAREMARASMAERFAAVMSMWENGVLTNEQVGELLDVPFTDDTLAAFDTGVRTVLKEST